jgi:hypothetical protein
MVHRTAVFAFLAALSACSNPNEARERERMERHRQVWNAQGIDDYRMTVHVGTGLIGGGAVIEVRDGVPVSIQPAEPDLGQLPLSRFAEYDTVEELFAVLERAFEADVHEVRAEYDTRYGLPVSVMIDPRRDVIDEERRFTVQGFTKL